MTPDEQLVDLMTRTLAAFVRRDVELIEQLTLEEWDNHTVGELFQVLVLLCMNLRELTDTPADGLAQLHVVGVPIDQSPPGMRYGARMVTAGLNGDIGYMRDLISAFCAEIPEHEMGTAAVQLFETVFTIAAEGVRTAYCQHELN